MSARDGDGPIGAALVVGGGIGGMAAALDFAAAGIKVFLLESGPCIGGVMAKLDKTFPTNDCAMCTMAPRLVEIGRHKDIEVLAMTEVERITGKPGRLRVEIRRKPRFVDEEKCTGCAACALACPLGKLKAVKHPDPKRPKPIPDEFNEGLSTRPAVYIPYAQAVPNAPVVDPERCLHVLTGKCGVCEKACKAGAIDFTQRETTSVLEVGAVVLAPGYSLFNAELKPEYGYGMLPDVLTAVEFERMLSASGPYSGKILRPSDKKEPRRVAFIQCVGSRDSERDYCSAVCCMYATKEALLAKEHLPGLECDVFYMDLRAFSKGFDEYYARAKAHGVRYIRSRPSLVRRLETGRLSVSHLAEGGAKASEEYDLVVLASGLRPPKTAFRLATVFGLTLNEHGFCGQGAAIPGALPSSSRERGCRQEAAVPGVFAAGTFTEPKDIPETVTQASAAVARALELLSGAKGELIASAAYPPEKEAAGQAPRIGVFICHCGTNIASVVGVAEVAGYARGLPDVVHAENVLYACSNDTQKRIQDMIREKDLNRVVVAACTPRTHEPLFRNTLREAGLNPYLFEMANIRDQCSWVHMQEAEKATRKAKDLVRMAVAKARLLEPLWKKKVQVDRGVLVLGGGLSGMSAALSLARQGHTVHLVERGALGGGNRETRRLPGEDYDPQASLGELESSVRAHPGVSVHEGTRLAAIDGCAGNFTSRLAKDGAESEVRHGAVIVATGARAHAPREHLYGTHPRVLTQLELAQRLAEGPLPGRGCGQGAAVPEAMSVSSREGGARPPVVAMIQCVGSRNETRPYCSRTCCTDAVRNALAIKERHPGASVYVFYRDVRTYGFREGLYTRARRRGVVFVLYDETRPPSVSPAPRGEGLLVSALEPVSGEEFSLAADWVALSAAVVPAEGAKDLAQMLKVPLDPNGFFLEAHMKLRPVDFATDGVFLCGAAHYPKSPEECRTQALAAAARAATFLSKDEMELEAAISQVREENCDGCAYCVEPCPYQAVSLVEYRSNGELKKRVAVNETLCKGCGVCQATCPKKGISVRGFRLEQIAAMVEAALAG